MQENESCFLFQNPFVLFLLCFICGNQWKREEEKIVVKNQNNDFSIINKLSLIP